MCGKSSREFESSTSFCAHAILRVLRRTAKKETPGVKGETLGSIQDDNLNLVWFASFLRDE
jgi:hypothetical protein